MVIISLLWEGDSRTTILQLVSEDAIHQISDVMYLKAGIAVVTNLMLTVVSETSTIHVTILSGSMVVNLHMEILHQRLMPILFAKIPLLSQQEDML